MQRQRKRMTNTGDAALTELAELQKVKPAGGRLAVPASRLPAVSVRATPAANSRLRIGARGQGPRCGL